MSMTDESSDSSPHLDALLPELQLHILSSLPISDLATVPVLSSSWKALVMDKIDQLRLSAGLLNMVAPGRMKWRRDEHSQDIVFRPRLSMLKSARALVAVGGYNSSAWNNGAHGPQADDGPGCERSSEVICSLRSESQAPEWCTLPSTAERRADLALVATPGSKLYALGGREGGTAHASVEMLDVARHQLFDEGWHAAPSMTEPRCAPAACCLGGGEGGRLIVVAGGENMRTAIVSKTVAAYDLETGSWSALPPMRHARSYFAAAMPQPDEPRWCVFGGRTQQGWADKDAECFDAARGEWTDLPRMLSRRHGAAGAAHRGRVLAVGGSHLPSMESYDPREGSWRADRFTALPVGLGWWGGCAHVEGDMLFVCGGSRAAPPPPDAPPGWSNTSLGLVWIFDLRRSLEPLCGRSKMRTPRWCGAAAVVNMAC